MKESKLYTKAWLKNLVEEARMAQLIDFDTTLTKLLDKLTDYLHHLDLRDSNRGRGTTERRVIASRENGKKGGRPPIKKTCCKCGISITGIWYGTRKTGYICKNCKDKEEAQ